MLLDMSFQQKHKIYYIHQSLLHSCTRTIEEGKQRPEKRNAKKI